MCCLSHWKPLLRLLGIDRLRGREDLERYDRINENLAREGRERRRRYDNASRSVDGAVRGNHDSSALGQITGAVIVLWKDLDNRSVLG
jgi:hypothetical protein